MARLVIKDSANTEQYFDKTIIEEQKALVSYVRSVGQSIRANCFPNMDYTYDLDANGDGKLLIYGRLYAKIENEGQKERFTIDNAQIHLPSDFTRRMLNFTADPEEFLFFRGEIIAARGKIEQGIFRAEEIYTDCRTSIPAPMNLQGDNKVLFVKGPLISNSLEEEAASVNAQVKEIGAGLVVYLGPFLKSDSKLLIGREATMIASDAYKMIFKILSDGLENCVFVSNIDDAISIPVYPTVPMEEDGGNYKVVGDPVLIDYGSTHFFVTSQDVFMTMSRQLDGCKKNRPQKFLNSLIVHNSICPVNAAFVQVDHLNAITPEVEPHFIVSPSLAGDGDINEFDFPRDRMKLEDSEAEAELSKKEEEEKAKRLANNQYTTSLKFRNMAVVSFKKEEDGSITRSIEYIKKESK